jgi:hypothetical protein
MAFTSVLPLVVSVVLAASAGEKPATVVQAPDSPVRIDRATIVTVADQPPVILFAATNTTGDELEQFTVIAFTFDEKGTLKARQIAPGRRTLTPRETKYSTIVLDGFPLGSTDQIVIGVNQVQRAGSETWWRWADIEPTAVAKMAPPTTKKP